MKTVVKILLIVFLVAMAAACTSVQGLLASISSGLGGSSDGSSSTGGLAAAKYDPNRRGDPDAANWDIAALDTAKDTAYLTGVEKDVILEMNKVRSNPKKYAELYIQPTLKYYNGRNYSEPGQITIVTQEGAAAVNSCISALSRSKNAGLLTAEKGIWSAAKDHAIDQSKTGKTGHDGSDGSNFVKRMERYGGGYKTAGENCAYGPNTGRDIVVQFLVDDGVPSRGHRANIMNGAFTQTGVSIQTHPQFRYCCVIDYANGYVSK
ncbi:MAG: CAP domain-containing protein [Treponematales bacterium]